MRNRRVPQPIQGHRPFQGQPHRLPFWLLTAVCVLGLLSACSPANSSAAGDPDWYPAVNEQARRQFAVKEYPLAEQSTDNPIHAQFLDHLPAEVRAQRAADEITRSPADPLALPNQALSLFGYRLSLIPLAQQTSFALYHDQDLLQDDILQIWPVTLNAAGDDFLLPFETLSGQRRMATRAGLADWPGLTEQNSSPPIFIGDRLAYAAMDDSQLTVRSEGLVLYSLPAQAIDQSSRLSAWSGHWALENDGRVVVDGHSINDSLHAQRIFNWQTIHNQPFFFYIKDGLIRMNYAGRSLPYVYDQIVAGDTPETALFRPGSDDHKVWFFALRDGLWYYVEAGIFEP